MEHSCENYLKFRPVVQEEMSFKEKVYGRHTEGGMTDDKQRTITIAHHEPLARVG